MLINGYTSVDFYRETKVTGYELCDNKMQPSSRAVRLKEKLPSMYDASLVPAPPPTQKDFSVHKSIHF